jgi:putative transcriptional regulator
MFFVRVSANLAQKVGVRRETIVFLEKEKYNPSLKLAHDLAVSLRASIEEFFLWDEKEEE